VRRLLEARVEPRLVGATATTAGGERNDADDRGYRDYCDDDYEREPRPARPFQVETHGL
jgi:hypothetical protein